MSRSTDSEKAARVSAAQRLLARGETIAEAALSLSRRYGISRRQAYRYLEEAKTIGDLVPAAEPKAAATFSLQRSLVEAARARAVAEGTTISEIVTRALRMLLSEASGNG